MQHIEKSKNFTVNYLKCMGVARETIYDIIRKTEERGSLEKANKSE